MSVGYALALRDVDACSISPRSAFLTPVGIPVTIYGTIQSVATHDASRPEASVKWYHPGSNGHLSQRAARTAPVGHPICSQCFPHRVDGGALMADRREAATERTSGGSCPSRNWRPSQPANTYPMGGDDPQPPGRYLALTARCGTGGERRHCRTGVGPVVRDSGGSRSGGLAFLLPR